MTVVVLAAFGSGHWRLDGIRGYEYVVRGNVQEVEWPLAGGVAGLRGVDGHRGRQRGSCGRSGGCYRVNDLGRLLRDSSRGAWDKGTYTSRSAGGGGGESRGRGRKGLSGGGECLGIRRRLYEDCFGAKHLLWKRGLPLDQPVVCGRHPLEESTSGEFWLTIAIANIPLSKLD